jgi:hypothetical protein
MKKTYSVHFFNFLNISATIEGNFRIGVSIVRVEVFTAMKNGM